MLARTLLIAGMAFGIVSVASAIELAPAGSIDVTPAAPHDTAKKAKKQARNMSGLLCPAADWCLLVSDELLGMHRLRVDRSADVPKLSYDKALTLSQPPAELLATLGIGELEELDLEALAGSADKVIFIGSHANKRKKGDKNPVSHLVAIADSAALASNAAVPAQWSSLDGLFAGIDELKAALNTPLQCRGINIEGATVFGDELLIGLRSPTVDPDGSKPGAYVVSTPIDGLAGGDFSGAALHPLPLDAPFIGIRSMETIGDKVLIVTGDAGVNDLPHEVLGCTENINKEDPSRPFQLRVWKPDGGNQLESGVLAEFPPEDAEDPDPEDSGKAKVEGIALAAQAGNAVSLFVVYDGVSKAFRLDGIELPQ
jgi:hypothetical protein